MRRDKNTASNDLHGRKTSNEDTSANEPAPPGKEDSRFVGRMKKVGFTVWLAVMVIGGALAFIVALFLV